MCMLPFQDEASHPPQACSPPLDTPASPPTHLPTLPFLFSPPSPIFLYFIFPLFPHPLSPMLSRTGAGWDWTMFDPLLTTVAADMAALNLNASCTAQAPPPLADVFIAANGTNTDCHYDGFSTGDGTTVATASTVSCTIAIDGARGFGHANVSTGTLHQAAINPFEPRRK